MGKLERVEKWHGRYRGVTFEVARQDPWEGREHDHPGGRWAHYILLHESQVPEAHHADVFLPHRLHRYSESGQELVIYDYMGGLLADLDWHCGITYYDLLCAVPGHRVVKAGCDYTHLWDVGAHYTELDAIHGAKKTIDSLRERMPDLRYRCDYCGVMASEADLTPWGEDNRIHPACEETRQAYIAKHAQKAETPDAR